MEVAENDEAVALLVVTPARLDFHLTFRVGGRHPIDRAAGGLALCAALPPSPGDSLRVAQAREVGYARTFGEVEPGAHGVAVPVPAVPGIPTCCLNLITHRGEIADRAPEALLHNAGPDPRAVAGTLPRLDVLLDTSGEKDVDLGRDLARLGLGRLETVRSYRDLPAALSRILAS